MDKLISKLRKAELKGGEVNVEDLLALLKLKDASICPELKRLKQDFNWKAVDNPENEVPLGAWADVICVYYERGFKALYSIAIQHTRLLGIVLGVLEEIKTEESLETVFSLFEFFIQNKNDLINAKKCVLTINLMISFDNKINFTDKLKADLLDLLYLFINTVDTEYNSDEGMIIAGYCAIRRVGNKDTIEFIKKRPKLKEEGGAGLESIVIKAIKKNLSNNK